VTATAGPAVLHGRAALLAAVGAEVGVSDWVRITQAEVDAFADVTGDHQWIHVEVERARAGQFGGTIVHGFFTLSLVPRLQAAVFTLDGFEFGLNYGLNKVRFPAPFPVGGRVRLHVACDEVQDVARGIQVLFTNTFECEGAAKPVCVAQTVFRLYGERTT
jgi:acyl dehydratase